MKKSIFCVLSVAAVMGAVLTSTAASAAVKANPPAGGDPDTTVTFAVTTGLLTMTAPASVNLGSGAPGTTVSGTMAATTVTDDRALLGATWTATASETDFTTGTGTTPETIPAADATYNPGTITPTGAFIAPSPVGTPITLANGAQTVVTGHANGDNSAAWDAALTVAIPAAAVFGPYTGTLTQSVS
jgi:hypothetical protein